ncbi:MAG: preprotein translocase subunit SecF [Candidatus Argoarchaeum ethanivorans]|uniref:Protein-export membrane protein SecF n=1 Tax=Candidatus Argoarchaeum ethanivorans TaxID=2608793 RepID=A0A8B3S7A3_9EURY|nr:MAG: preprotein translocase subunit SecF [Candidatus Argoarchaeum ethanivorans]
MDRIDNTIDAYFNKFTTKQSIIIPLVVVVISLLILTATTLTVGTPVKLGMEFVGGSAIIIDTPESPGELQEAFSDYPLHSEPREHGNRKLLQFESMSQEKQNELTNFAVKEYGSENVEMRQVGEVFGKSQQIRAVQAVVIAFLLMAAVVLILFRKIIPAVTVIFAAFADIIFAMAMMNIFGLTLTFGTFAAILMLIGYAVDTNLLLTNRVLKRRGDPMGQIKNAMKTGLTMTSTTLAALLVLFLISTISYLAVSSFTRIDIVRDIAVVLIFGLLADVMNTWMFNTGILRKYIIMPRGGR